LPLSCDNNKPMMNTSTTVKNDLPAWAETLRRQFIADECSQFLLHGNVYDYYRFQDRYWNLRDFLRFALLTGKWSLFFNRSEGLIVHHPDGSIQNPVWLQMLGESGAISDTMDPAPQCDLSDPERVLTLLDRVIQTSRSAQRDYAVILDYIDTLVPETSMVFLSDTERKNLITLQRWADDVDLRFSNGVVLMIAETASEVNTRIRSHPGINLIELPFPDQMERSRYIDHLLDGDLQELVLEMSREKLTDMTSGLSLVHIEKLLRSAHKQKLRLDHAMVIKRKNMIIEKESGGLLEVVYPKHGLEDCAGHRLAIKRIQKEISKIQTGQYQKCSAGIILVGEMGTGKTFLTFAIAFEFGLPVVIIKNILGGLVGLSDSNQEKMLSLLEAMAPILVVVDEADVFFGKRKSEGDSGVQSRQFGRYATFMSQGTHRGRVFWILNSAHPDNLADDFKRPGRCDLIIPLFPLLDGADQKEAIGKYFEQQNRIFTNIDWDRILLLLGEKDEKGWPKREWTASDLIKIAAVAEDLTAEKGRPDIDTEDLETSILQYSPGSLQLVKKYQRYLAITESTATESIPEPYRSLPTEDVFRHLRELKMQLGDRI
jgi:SpoVK/Ycf46/Vps4 family AAA+-type ATPase